MTLLLALACVHRPPAPFEGCATASVEWMHVYVCDDVQVRTGAVRMAEEGSQEWWEGSLSQGFRTTDAELLRIGGRRHRVLVRHDSPTAHIWVWGVPDGDLARTSVCESDRDDARARRACAAAFDVIAREGPPPSPPGARAAVKVGGTWIAAPAGCEPSEVEPPWEHGVQCDGRSRLEWFASPAGTERSELHETLAGLERQAKAEAPEIRTTRTPCELLGRPAECLTMWSSDKSVSFAASDAAFVRCETLGIVLPPICTALLR